MRQSIRELVWGLLILLGFGLFTVLILVIIMVSDKIRDSLPNTLKWVTIMILNIPVVGFFTYVQWRELSDKNHKFSAIKTQLLKSTAVVWTVGSLAGIVCYFASAGFWIIDFSTSYSFYSESIGDEVCVEYLDTDFDYRQSQGGCETYKMLEVPFRDYIEGNIREEARIGGLFGGWLITIIIGFYVSVYKKKNGSKIG